MNEFHKFQKELSLMEEYYNINHEGFRKISKKYEKILKIIYSTKNTH